MTLSPVIAIWLRTEDINSVAVYFVPLVVYTVTSAVTRALIYIWSGLYREYWPYASVQELQTLAKASALGTIGVLGLDFLILMPTGAIATGFPRSVPLIDALLTLLLLEDCGSVLGSFSMCTRTLYLTNPSSPPLSPAPVWPAP